MTDTFTVPTVETPTAHTEPWETEVMTAPNSDRSERFRALRNEVDGDMAQAIELLDVARLRNHALRAHGVVLNSRIDELQATVDRLASEVNVALERVSYFQSQAERLGRPISDFQDGRLEPLWEQASRQADAEGFCSEYERMCDAFGIPGRERDYSVDVEVTLTRTITVSATGRDEDQAAESIDEDLITAYLDGRFYPSDWELSFETGDAERQ